MAKYQGCTSKNLPIDFNFKIHDAKQLIPNRLRPTKVSTNWLVHSTDWLVHSTDWLVHSTDWLVHSTDWFVGRSDQIMANK